ncbi:hypothetical protein [Kitasatospora sp. NPDC088783]|uniref:hypothetical protein n=1 Tax=Kitasatospora sp. NPDC088783 TaxID=3364077 RepID=UPI003804C25F
MKARLQLLVRNLVRAIERGDVADFQRRSGELLHESRKQDDRFRTAVVEEIARLLPGVAGEFSKLAVVAGACVELGGSPLPLAEVLPVRSAAALEGCVVFAEEWGRVSGDRGALPDRGDPQLMRSVLERLLEGDRYTEPEVAEMVVSYLDLDNWLKASITAMGNKEFRAAMTSRERLRRAAGEFAASWPRAGWLHGLSLVLDEEPLVVLHPGTGNGYRLTMSGVGDNFQLYTLLADVLIGDPADGLLPGERPDPAWVDAALTGPQISEGGPIARRFLLHDAYGGYVEPEGRPANIPVFEGVRTLVVRPSPEPFGWLAGRTYAHMRATVELDSLLSREETARLISGVRSPSA